LKGTVVPDVTKFAGFRSPWSLVTDPSLGREDKIGGLRTWHALLSSLPDGEGDPAARARLLKEVERALGRLAVGDGSGGHG
jgi:hypothetical protein